MLDTNIFTCCYNIAYETNFKRVAYYTQPFTSKQQLSSWFINIMIIMISGLKIEQK